MLQDLITEVTTYASNQRDVKPLLSDHFGLLVLRVLMYGVTPAISMFGVIGNAFSLVVLRRQKKNKCSNIILFHLAFADLVFLISFNGVPKILYEVAYDTRGFHYNAGISKALFVIHVFLNTLDYGMSFVVLTLPVLITLERICAVFFPLHVHTIVTPKRTRVAVGSVYVFWYSLVVYMSTSFRFWIVVVGTENGNISPSSDINSGVPFYEANVNTTNASIYESYTPSSVTPISPPIESTTFSVLTTPFHEPQRTESVIGMFDQTSGTVSTMMDVLVYLGIRVPPIVTFTGCIFIIWKVYRTSRKRQNLTSGGSNPVGDDSVHRTTKMLLAVCAMYTVTCCVSSLPSLLPQYVTFTVTDNEPSVVQRIMYQLVNIVMCINSSSNFIIYVVMNKNFRDAYIELATPRCCTASKT